LRGSLEKPLQSTDAGKRREPTEITQRASWRLALAKENWLRTKRDHRSADTLADSLAAEREESKTRQSRLNHVQLLTELFDRAIDDR